MNIKLSALASGILFGLSNVASAQPPAAPSLYQFGPGAVELNTTDLSAAERGAFALFESTFKVVESKIHATSCKAASFDVEVFANGYNNVDPSPVPPKNYIKVSSGGQQQFRLDATLSQPVPGFGQQVHVAGSGGFLNGTTLISYSGDFAYNNINNMLVSKAITIALIGINGGAPDVYSGNLIKDFYRGEAVDDTNPEFYNIYDWGLQSISKLGYPVNKWWQRSKTHRSDGIVGVTQWVNDRLVGSTPCRIQILTNGYNNQDYFWQGGAIGSGKLTISQDVEGVTPVVWQ